MVRLPLSIYEDFGVVTQTSINPAHHVTNFKACILDIYHHSMLRACAACDQRMASRLQYAHGLFPNFHAWHVIVPFFSHK